MGVNYSILFSITSFFRPAIHKSMAARQAQIDDLIRKQGLGPGHNRAYARINPDAFPRLVRTFKESVLKRSAAEQPFLLFRVAAANRQGSDEPTCR